MSVSGIVQLRMSGGNLYNDLINQLYRCTELEIDPDDYNGVDEVRFYAVVGASAAESLKLVGIASDAVLTENLDDGGFAVGSTWAASAGASIAGGKVTFSGANANATLTQTAANLAIALVAGAYYELTYTISNTDAYLYLCSANINTAVCEGAGTLPITPGTHTVHFFAKAGVTDFIIDLHTSFAGFGTFSIDDISVKRIEFTEYAALTPDTGVSMKRMTDIFALPAVKTKFYFYMPASASATLNVRTGGIEIDVVNATKVRVQLIPFVMGNASSGGLLQDQEQNDYWAYALSTINSNYGYSGIAGVTDDVFRIWLRDASKWATVDHFTHEVIAGTVVGDYDELCESGMYAVFNKTSGLQVTGTELTFTEQTPTRKEIDFNGDAANFTDGNEFEERMKAVNNVANNYGTLLYRAALYVTLTSASRVQFELQLGTCTYGWVGGSGLSINFDERFDVESRYLHEPTKFSAGTKFYFESTAVEQQGSASLYMYDCSTEDEGAPSKSGIPVAVGDGGSWVNPEKTLVEDNDPATWQSAVPNATNIIALVGFTFAGWPAGATINQLEVAITGRVIEQTCTMKAKINSEAYVSNYWTASPTVQTGLNFTIPGPWDIATLQACTAYVQAVHPNNATLTNWELAFINLQATFGIALATSKLDFSTTDRERQRTADLTDVLTDGDRYITYVTATSTPLASIGAHSASFIIAEVTGAEVSEVSRAIEYFMPQELFSEIRDAFFVHCGLTWDGGDAVDITGITNANPAVVTAPGHTFVNGDRVRIAGVLGMTEVNNADETTAYTVAGVSGNTFQLSGIDSSAWGVYAAGSTVQKVTNSVSGLPTGIYYDGRTIRALGDGTYEYNGTAVVGGVATFPWYANIIHVGLPFSTILEPMNPNAGSQQGTARGKKQKINRVTLCFYETMGCEIGINQDLLHDIPVEDAGAVSAQPHFEAGVLFTEDMTVDLRGEWEDKATISIVHDRATPFTLKAVVPHVNINEP
jgi:hypothetical protein